MPTDQSVVPIANQGVDQSVANGITSQNTITEEIWREFQSASFRLGARYIDRLAQIYGLDEGTIKRLVFLRYRLMSKHN